MTSLLISLALAVEANGCFMNTAIQRPASITLNALPIYVPWSFNVNVNNRCVSAWYGSPATIPTSNFQSGLNILQITPDAGYSSYVISTIRISPQ